jgi:hypothetical protein
LSYPSSASPSFLVPLPFAPCDRFFCHFLPHLFIPSPYKSTTIPLNIQTYWHSINVCRRVFTIRDEVALTCPATFVHFVRKNVSSDKRLPGPAN